VQQTTQHTPPALTPSSYGNVLEKRARRSESRRESSTEGAETAEARRLRVAADLEARGILSTQQKALLTARLLEADVGGALDRYAAGDSSDLERVINQGGTHSDNSRRDFDDSLDQRSIIAAGAEEEEDSRRRQDDEKLSVLRSVRVSAAQPSRVRAASIDLLAELELDDGPLSAPRKPPPSAECLHDDQLMGFEMEMPFLPFSGGTAVVVATNHPDNGNAKPRRLYDDVVDDDSKPRVVVRSNYRARNDDDGTDDEERRPPVVVTQTDEDSDAASPSSAHRGSVVEQWAFDDESRFGGKKAPGGFLAEKKTPTRPTKTTTTTTTTTPRTTTATQDATLIMPATVAYEGKISSTVAVPPAASDLNEGQAPPYEALVNFPRAKSRAKIHCVMCGRYPRGVDDDAVLADEVVVIPRQNKDVCRDCDKALWRHNESNTHFKWCKGCKRFRNLTAFAEKVAASKCDRCRERGRLGYQRRKGGSAGDDAAGGLSLSGDLDQLADADLA